jgi:hypothetical protein
MEPMPSSNFDLGTGHDQPLLWVGSDSEIRPLASATEELKHLEYLRARVSGKIDMIRP